MQKLFPIFFGDVLLHFPQTSSPDCCWFFFFFVFPPAFFPKIGVFCASPQQVPVGVVEKCPWGVLHRGSTHWSHFSCCKHKELLLSSCREKTWANGCFWSSCDGGQTIASCASLPLYPSVGRGDFLVVEWRKAQPRSSTCCCCCLVCNRMSEWPAWKFRGCWKAALERWAEAPGSLAGSGCGAGGIPWGSRFILQVACALLGEQGSICKVSWYKCKTTWISSCFASPGLPWFCVAQQSAGQPAYRQLLKQLY